MKDSLTEAKDMLFVRQFLGYSYPSGHRELDEPVGEALKGIVNQNISEELVTNLRQHVDAYRDTIAAKAAKGPFIGSDGRERYTNLPR